jgi:hypothetical protein
MATKKTVSVSAEFRKDTAKGKKHFAIENDKIAGAIYLTPETYKSLGSPDTIEVTVGAA